MHIELVELSRRKELTGRQERNRLHREMSNWEWLSDVSLHRNGTEFYQEEYMDNICLRYGLMPQEIPATCNGCGKKFSIEHDLS